MDQPARGRLEALLRLCLTALLLAEVLAQFAAQPWLHDPTAIGTDPSTYYAAGLRLNAGHSLYGPLLPSDRPVPLVLPYFSVPLLSPPTIAVIWRVLALPGPIAMYAWWATALVLMIAVTSWMIWTGSRLQVRLIILMLTAYPVVALVTGWTTSWFSVFPGIPDSAVSGNVNAYLVVLLVLVWWASAKDRPMVAGTAAALATSLKLLPVLLLPWFVATRNWRAAVAFLCAAAVLLFLTIVGAGWNNAIAYLGVVGQTRTSGATSISLPGIARALGAPDALVAAVSPLVIAGALVFAFAMRSRPGLTFGAMVVAVVFGSPVIHQGTLALLLAAIAPLSPSVPWRVPSGFRTRTTVGSSMRAVNRGSRL